jgi:transcriptional regulator with XRE-family HTH domain
MAKQPGNIYGRRLREARESYGFSQPELGIAARLDESGASPRISRYETGANEAKEGMKLLLARVLALPLSYFHIEDDEEALRILASCRSEEPLQKLQEVRSRKEKLKRQRSKSRVNK